MKHKLLLLGSVPAISSILLALIVLVPSVQNYPLVVESPSYAFGGWGAVYNTGVYYFSDWTCACGGDVQDCCKPLLADVIWPVVGALIAADILSILLLTKRLMPKFPSHLPTKIPN